MGVTMEQHEFKVGEECFAECHTYSGCEYHKRVVGKITKTQIITTDGNKYRRDNHREITSHSTWCGRDILVPSGDEILKLVALQKSRTELHILIDRISKSRIRLIKDENIDNILTEAERLFKMIEDGCK
jgi:hypothetical protein